MKKIDLTLYLITDHRIPWRESLASVRRAILGGVTVVQLREKTSSPDEIFEKARELLTILRPLGVPLIINDSVEMARAVGADGVHVGKKDADVKEARKILGPRAIIGLSVDDAWDFEKSDFEFCDYVSASPVFPTATKADAAKAMGVQGLRRLREACPIPLVAIGGINELRAQTLGPVGIEGICVVSSLASRDLDPERGARRLRKIFETAKRGRE